MVESHRFNKRIYRRSLLVKRIIYLVKRYKVLGNYNRNLNTVLCVIIFYERLRNKLRNSKFERINCLKTRDLMQY